MKVYVLTGCISYEDREVLGVYKSVEEARYQVEEVARESLGGWDYYELSVHTLGGDAQLMEVVGHWSEEDLVDEAA